MAIRQQTVIEQADQICDAIFGVSPYQGVLILNRASDYCTGRALALATVDPEAMVAYAESAARLGILADQLDEALVAETAAYFGGRA